MADVGKRPFWAHQLVEYILGGALVAMGLQSPTPVVPAVVGGLVMGHAAITKGPLAAFRVLGRKVHRVIDPVIIAVEFAGGLQPTIEVEPSTRLVVVGVALVHPFVWWQTSFAEKPPRAQRVASTATPGDRSTEIGRSIGRAAGVGVSAVRRAKERRRGADD